jgi:hypothetical protein
MRKQVAVRFSHPGISMTLLTAIAGDASVVRYEKKPNVFDIVVSNLLDYEAFADKVENVTKYRPNWSLFYAVDIKKVAA